MRGHVEIPIEFDAFGDGVVHGPLHERAVLHVLHVMRRLRWFFLSKGHARREQADAKYFRRSHRRTPRRVAFLIVARLYLISIGGVTSAGLFLFAQRQMPAGLRLLVKETVFSPPRNHQRRTPKCLPTLPTPQSCRTVVCSRHSPAVKNQENVDSHIRR
jgi:hypothetical protein